MVVENRDLPGLPDAVRSVLDGLPDVLVRSRTSSWSAADPRAGEADETIPAGPSVLRDREATMQTLAGFNGHGAILGPAGPVSRTPLRGVRIAPPEPGPTRSDPWPSRHPPVSLWA